MDIISNSISPIGSTSTALALLLLTFLFFTILFHRSSLKQTKKRYHPVAGTIFSHLTHFHTLHHYMTDLARKHKTYRILSPFHGEIFTSDPANVEYILKTNFSNYGKGGHNYSILSDLLGDGIFAVDGDKWRHQRKISSYEFSTRTLRDFSSAVFQKNAVKLARIIAENAASNSNLNGWV